MENLFVKLSREKKNRNPRKKKNQKSKINLNPAFRKDRSKEKSKMTTKLWKMKINI